MCRAENQNPGGRTLGKTEWGFWSYPRIKMIEYSARVHTDVTEMRSAHEGKHSLHFESLSRFFLFRELFIVCQRIQQFIFLFLILQYSRPCRWIFRFPRRFPPKKHGNKSRRRHIFHKQKSRCKEKGNMWLTCCAQSSQTPVKRASMSWLRW